MTGINAAVQAAIAKAASQTDMNEAQKGGGDYQPPAAGITRLRFVGYVEVGKKFNEKFNKTQEKVKLIFELSGPKHEPRKTDSGELIPHRITVIENLSLNEKANFYKLFKAMNYDGSATHIAQLLGREYLGTVVHVKKDKNVYANLRDDNGYTIRSPYYEDPVSGETHFLQAGPQISDIRCFLWDYADKEMWDSLYIEGQYDEEKDDEGKVTRPAKSKNVFQEEIKAAVNFEGSPIAEILGDSALNIGQEPDAGTSEESPKGGYTGEPDSSDNQAAPDEHDPLAGVV